MHFASRSFTVQTLTRAVCALLKLHGTRTSRPAADPGAFAGHGLAPGKRRLIEAALRLTAGGRSFATLGLRELAREAGLNPNTFYRHFDTLDDLAREAVEWVSRRLRPMLRRERWLAAHDEPHSVPRRACVAFFAFALDNREAFLSALAEYHGTSPALREAVRANLHEVSAEMADDVVQLNLMPALAPRDGGRSLHADRAATVSSVA